MLASYVSSVISQAAHYVVDDLLAISVFPCNQKLDIECYIRLVQNLIVIAKGALLMDIM